MKPQRLITLFLLGTLLTVGANTTFNEGTVLATYMDSYANGPKPGWRFLWNENGEIDEPAGYVPLILLPGPERRTWMNYYVNKDNTVRMGLSCFVPGCPEGQTRRHAIAAYTLSSDIDGDIWLTSGNFRAKSPMEMRIYVNDTLKLTESAKPARTPHLFQYNA